jgi:hypothetical protein
VAIGEQAGTRTLYGVRDDVEGIPGWAPQVASFYRSHVDSRGWRGAHGEEVLEEVTVQCLPLTDLLQGVKTIDLL